MSDLSRKRERQALSPRREPYWQRLAEGAYLGFRRGPDTWVARFRGRDGKQQYNALAGAVEFDDAKKAAEAWLSQLTGSPVRTPKRDTVKAALETYLAYLKQKGREDAAKEALGRFKLTVYEDPISDISLETATIDDFLEWRDRLRKGRQPRSINRHVRSVMAGLNRAHKNGHIGNPATWRIEPLEDDVEDEGETAIFLTPDQRNDVIAAASSNAAEFFSGLNYTGARPKELAATKLSDFDGKSLRLMHRKGRPPKPRVRYSILANDAVEFFKAQAKGKLPGAYLFTEDGETPWRRHVWAREFRAAITKHNQKAKGKSRLPLDASAYSFRHARISELLQVHHVDPLTVAQQTGTSLAMIEKNYFRFIESAMREKLEQVKQL